MDLGEAMISAGYARAFVKYSAAYFELGNFAKLLCVAIEQGPVQSPLKYWLQFAAPRRRWPLRPQQMGV